MECCSCIFAVIKYKLGDFHVLNCLSSTLFFFRETGREDWLSISVTHLQKEISGQFWVCDNWGGSVQCSVRVRGLWWGLGRWSGVGGC